MINIPDCQHGYLYKIEARNLAIGVFDKQIVAFLGIRTKFNHRFIDREFHWDHCPRFGTAKPLALLEECPIALDDRRKELFQWLDMKLEFYYNQGILPWANFKKDGDTNEFST